MTERPKVPPDDYRLLFENGPAAYLILLPEPDFKIAEVNEAYLQATKQTRDSLIGLAMFDAFPDNPADPTASGTRNLRASLERALASGEPDTMAIQRYDIPKPSSEGGGFEERYWSPVNTPVKAADGRTRYIIHRVEDVTQFVQLVRAQEIEKSNSASLQARNDAMMAELVNRGEQLNEANQRLRAEAERKNEFLAMLAHELRNPLAAVANVAHLLEPFMASNRDAQKLLDVLQRQVGSLKVLVDSLLDVSRLTRGLIDLNWDRVDLAEVVDYAVQSVQPLMVEKQHQIVVSDIERPTYIKGDVVRLEQTIVNLLTNAARYTDTNGCITITLKQRESHVELCVRDTGIGLAPDMLHQIFDIFAQGERELARTEGGLGIGLTVVKNLVELHGGKVTAHSEGPGRGAEFLVRLPLAPGQALEQLDESLEPHAHVQSRRILIVEDNRDIADTMAALLEQWGHHVEVAYDGPTGIESAEASRPELVLLDIGLPGMNGYEVAHELRNNPHLNSTVLAALTGYGKPDDRQRVLSAGFDAHFIKPVDLTQLEEFIATL